MAYIDNNISFTTFDGNSLSRIKKVGNEQCGGATVDDLADIASDNGGKLPTIINAVEIDWNGADLSSALGEKYSSINTTGQLLSAIKEDFENTAIIGGNSEMIRRGLWIN